MSAFDAFSGSAELPEWHREWISEFALERALRTYAESAGPDDKVDSRIWENACLAIVRDVAGALAPLDEDLETIRAAQYLGAESFLRCFFRLLNLGGPGGRA